MPKNDCDKDDFIIAIIDQLRPWKYPEKPFHLNKGQSLEKYVEKVARREIEALIKLVAAQRKAFNRRGIRKSAREISDAVTWLERLLTNVPPGLAYSLLFGSPTTVNLAQLRHLVDREDMADLMAALAEHLHPLLVQLQRMREICRAEEKSGGLHPNVGLAQHLCSALAYDLMRSLSKAKIDGTPTGKLRTIATHLYQICTGEPTDMRRAAHAVLQYHRQLGTLQPKKPYRRSTPR